MSAATTTFAVQGVPTRAARLYAAATIVACAIMCLRIASTYSIFTQTYDEPIHIACGMEWLDRGIYHYEPQHPPLSRIAAAVGPYLLGERSHGWADDNAEGNAILSAGSRYRQILTASRVAELPFAILAVAGVWIWARRYFGPLAAFFSALLLSMLPPVLAHSGLATTDIAVTAGCTWAFYAFVRFLDHRTWKTSVALGFWSSVALLSKFSSIPFLACGFLAIFLACKFCSRSPEHTHDRIGLWRALSLGFATSFLLIWAGYRFSFQPLFGPDEPRVRTSDVPQLVIQPGLVRTLLTTVPIPAHEFFRGVAQVARHNKMGHWSYLLGELRNGGWWYFFPVVLAIKTPLGFLVLGMWGGGMLLMRLRQHEWQRAAAPLAAVSVLLVCILSRIDLGVRHILPIYPLLSLGAGYLVADSLAQFRRFRSVFVLSCVLWCGVDSVRAHPDYLAWFNPIASERAERFRVDSDLDWGQDLGRLSQRLQELHVSSIAISYYFGAADPRTFGLPPVHQIPCDGPLTGYVAISLNMLYIGQPLESACPARFLKLQQIKPTERIGKSIFLYYFPPGSQGP